VVKWLRIAAIFLADLSVAGLGPVIIAQLHPHGRDRVGLLQLEAARSIGIGFFLGFFVYYLWKTRSSRWVWVVGILWFAYGAVTYWNSQHYLRLSQETHSIYWEMSGVGCRFDVQSCYDWLGYTCPLLRTIFYSAGAFLCSHLLQRGWGGWPMLSSIRIHRPFGEKEGPNEES
jgi:hypothetical protein